jgi:hypothetical protein
MSQKFAMKAVPFLAFGLLLGVLPSCSKEKQESATGSAPATAPVVTMKEPDSAPVQAPSNNGSVTVRARFDGYAARVAKGLWQPVPLTAEVANFGLITPLESISAESGLVVEGGPEGLAVGTSAGTLQTTDGRPLLAGREYSFSFSKGADAIWSVEIKPAP